MVEVTIREGETKAAPILTNTLAPAVSLSQSHPVSAVPRELGATEAVGRCNCKAGQIEAGGPVWEALDPDRKT